MCSSRLKFQVNAKLQSIGDANGYQNQLNSHEQQTTLWVTEPLPAHYPVKTVLKVHLAPLLQH